MAIEHEGENISVEVPEHGLIEVAAGTTAADALAKVSERRKDSRPIAALVDGVLADLDTKLRTGRDRRGRHRGE